MQKLFVAAAIAITVLLALKTPAPFTVTGKITDGTGQPISGVIIKIKNDSTITQSSVEGTYAIIVPDTQAVLEFSSVGYLNKNIKVKNQRIINVKLMPTVNALEEVVVVGYSTLRSDGYSDINSKVRAQPMQQNYAAGNQLAGKLASSQISGQIADSKNAHAGKEEEPGGEGYDFIKENSFVKASGKPLSTFSIDVVAAAYSNVRRILQQGNLPPAGAVRIEEMVNYFTYDYPQPEGDKPFSVSTEIGKCHWNSEHRLALIGLQGKNIPVQNLPASNLFFNGCFRLYA